jgi:hypothetical protein
MNDIAPLGISREDTACDLYWDIKQAPILVHLTASLQKSRQRVDRVSYRNHYVVEVRHHKRR